MKTFCFLALFFLSFCFASDYPSAIFEGEPMSLVAECADAISGSFFVAEEDIVVEAVEPIRVIRTYVSGKANSKISGWEIMPHLYLEKIKENKKKYLIIAEPNGAKLKYSHYQDYYRLSLHEHGKNITNTSKGIISGQTNLKNTRIVSFKVEGDEGYKLTTGNGTERHYRICARKSEGQSKRFYLRFEKLPNGNWLDYIYDEQNIIKRIESKNPSRTKLYAWVNFEYQGDVETITASDGQVITYRHHPHHGRYHQIDSTRKPHEHNQTVLNNRLHYHKGPNGRSRGACYYTQGDNENIKINNASDGRINRLKYLKAPISPDGKEEITHRFLYDLRPNPDKATEVWDAYQNKTLYLFSKQGRPKSIIFYESKQQSQTPLYSEHFNWEKHGQIKGNLQSKQFKNADESLYSERTLHYDQKGNVLTETLIADFTDTTRYTYYNSHFNLIKSKAHTNGLSYQYEYLPGTNLPTKKLTLDHGSTILRETYIYNKDNLLIEEIIDDGDNFTERHIKRITPKATAPALNFPEIIEELYIENNREKLLRKTVCHYSDQNQLIQTDIYDSTNSLRYSLHIAYDEKRRIIQKTDPLGRVSHFKYDENNNLIYEDHSDDDFIIENTYDLCNRLIAKVKKGSDDITVSEHYRYDLKNRLVKTIDAFSNETNFDYDGLDNQTSIRKPKIHTLNQPKHPIARRSYDIAGHIIEEIDPEKHTTTKEVSFHGHPKTIKHPNGTVERYNYNSDGTLNTAIAPNKRATTYTYDVLGRKTSSTITSPSGEVLEQESFTYNAFHLLTHKAPNGLLTTYYYDGAGRKIEETILGNNIQKTTQYKYDSLGNLSQVITHLPEGQQITSYQYDLLGRIVQEQEHDDEGNLHSQIATHYDPFGNKIRITTLTEAGESSNLYTYDSFKRITGHINPLNHQTHTTYNDAHINDLHQKVLQTTILDPIGTTTITTYDAIGQIHSIEKRDNFNQSLIKEVFIYNQNGKLIQQTSTLPQTNKTIQKRWEYDKQNNPITLIEAYNSPNQRITRFTYTPEGLKKTHTKPDQTTLNYTYDLLGRQTSLSSSDHSVHYTYTYDQSHNITQIHDHLTDTTTIRTYDQASNLLEETLATNYTTTYHYDSLGRRIAAVLPDFSQITYEYDTYHLRHIHRFNSQEQHLYTHSYTTYGLNHQLLSEQSIIPTNTIQYQTDLLDRRITASSSFHYDEIHSFDPLGNVTTHNHNIYTYDALSQLTSENHTTYTYDGHHNRITQNDTPIDYDLHHQLQAPNHTYDSNGNLLKDNTNTYTYDALDRLIQVQTPTQTITYTYDGFHRRLTKNDTHYLYDESNEIGSITPDYKETRILGLGRGAEIGATIAIETNDEITLPIHDLFGNILFHIDPITKYRTIPLQYSAFGIHDQTSQSWTYLSKRYDPETNLIFFGRRYYNPQTGRYLTTDPKSYDEGPNLYQFCLNNPLLNLDLYGEAVERSQSAFSRGYELLTSIYDFLDPASYINDVAKGSYKLVSGDYKTSQGRSCFFQVGGDFEHPNYSVFLSNGVDTNIEEITLRGLDYSKKLGGIKVNIIYNNTHGIFIDCIDALCEKLHIETRIVRKTRRCLTKQLEYSNKNLVFVTSSEGAIIYCRAVEKLSQSMTNRIWINTVGPAEPALAKHGGIVDNYASLGDIVTLSNLRMWVYRFTRPKHVTFLEPQTKCGFAEHLMNGKTYSQVPEIIVDKMNEKYVPIK